MGTGTDCVVSVKDRNSKAIHNWYEMAAYATITVLCLSKIGRIVETNN